MNSLNYEKKNTYNILNSLNDKISGLIKPIIDDCEEQMGIANEINSLLERLPKYKQLIEKYNILLEKYQILERENCALRDTVNINKVNTNNNQGYWYENMNEVNIKIIDDTRSNCNIQDGDSYKKITDIYKTLNKIIDYKSSITKTIPNNDNIDDEEKEDQDEEKEEQDDEEQDNEEDEEDEEDEEEQDDEEQDEEEQDDEEQDDEEQDDEECDNSDSDVEVFEKSIGKQKYYVTHDINGAIYEFINADIVGKKMGILKNGMAYL